MRHRLIAVVVALSLVGAGYALTRNGERPSAAGAGLLLSDLAVAPVSAAEANLAELKVAALPAASMTDAGDAGASYAVGGSSRTSMLVSEEQKAEIRRQIALLGAGDAARSPLRDLAIGAKLPREKVQLRRLPSAVTRVVPKYGAYEYFLTATGAIVIVDPAAYEIVDIVGA